MTKLVQFRELLRPHFDLDSLVLFGSYAKGEQRTNSDIDVAVIVNRLPDDFLTYAPLLWKLRRSVDERIEPILFQKGMDDNGFLSTILKEGVKVG